VTYMPRELESAMQILSSNEADLRIQARLPRLLSGILERGTRDAYRQYVEHEKMYGSAVSS